MNEIRQKFEKWLITEAIDDGEIEWDAWRAAYEAGEIAMKEKAAAVCELGNSPHIGCLANSPEGNIYVPSGGTCHVAMARAIRALPLSGAEESKK